MGRSGERCGVNQNEKHQESAEKREAAHPFVVRKKKNEDAKSLNEPRPKEHFSDAVDMGVFVGVPCLSADEWKEVVVHDVHGPDHADHQHRDNELYE